MVEAENQLRQTDALATEREREEQQMENLRQKTETTQTQIDAIQEEHGSNLEREAELRRLKQQKKNHQNELEIKKKEVAALDTKQKTEKKNKQRWTDSEQASPLKRTRETP